MSYYKTLLQKAVSESVYSNKRNNIPSRITEITFNTNKEAQYIIIATHSFAGKKERYFAIPILPAFIELDDSGKLLFNLDREDLILAKRIHFDNCPTIKENGFFPSVYEVYGYEPPNRTPQRKKAV